MSAGELEPERFVPILDALRSVLLKYDFIEDATFVAELIDLAYLESPDFARRLQGGRIWGKGLADIAFRGNVEGRQEDLRRNDVRYKQLLIQLADEMKAQGIASDGSEFVADAFRKGMEILRARGDWVPSSDDDLTA